MADANGPRQPFRSSTRRARQPATRRFPRKQPPSVTVSPSRSQAGDDQAGNDPASLPQRNGASHEVHLGGEEDTATESETTPILNTASAQAAETRPDAATELSRANSAQRSESVTMAGRAKSEVIQESEWAEWAKVVTKQRKQLDPQTSAKKCTLLHSLEKRLQMNGSAGAPPGWTEEIISGFDGLEGQHGIGFAAYSSTTYTDDVEVSNRLYEHIVCRVDSRIVPGSVRFARDQWDRFHDFTDAKCTDVWVLFVSKDVRAKFFQLDLFRDEFHELFMRDFEPQLHGSGKMLARTPLAGLKDALEMKRDPSRMPGQGAAVGCLHVKNIGSDMAHESELREIFSNFGDITAITLRTASDDKKPSWALISFKGAGSVARAIDQQGTPELEDMELKSIDPSRAAGSAGAYAEVMAEHEAKLSDQSSPRYGEKGNAIDGLLEVRQQQTSLTYFELKFLVAKYCALQRYVRVIDLPAIDNRIPGGGFGSDGVRYFAKMLEEEVTLPNIRYLRFGSGQELIPAFQIVLAQLKRRKPVPILKISFDNSVERSVGRAFFGQGKKLEPEFDASVDSVSGALSLALYMAARCKLLMRSKPQERDELLNLAEHFEEHAFSLLDQCNNKVEAERVLLGCDIRLGNMAVIDFVKRSALAKVASCRWCQMYTHDLWWVASIHTKIFRSAPKPCIRRAGGIGLKCGIDEPLQLTSEQLNQICMSNGKPWGEGVVLAMLPFITVGSILGIALSMILLPLSWVPCMPTVVGHTSSSLSLHIKAMWSVPAILWCTYAWIYTIFVFQVSFWACTIGSSTSINEIYVYVYGLGLLVSEVHEIINNFASADDADTTCASDLKNSLKEVADHINDKWNILDWITIVLILVICYTRLPLMWDPELADHKNADTGFDGLTWEGDHTLATLAALVIVVWLRAMYLPTLHPKLGPLILTIFKMTADVALFAFLALVFIIGFAAAIVPMYIINPTHKLGNFGGALIQTMLGVVGEQDMDTIQETTGGMLLYMIYLFIMAVILLNLLIAMLSSTYEHLKESSLTHWRFLVACTIMDHSISMDNISEIAPFAIIAVPLQLLLSIAQKLAPCFFGTAEQIAEKTGRCCDNYLYDVPGMREERRSIYIGSALELCDEINISLETNVSYQQTQAKKNWGKLRLAASVESAFLSGAGIAKSAFRKQTDELFAEIDENKDGQLSTRELKNGLHAIKETTGLITTANKIFEQMDSDNSKLIDADEFYKFLRDANTSAPGEGPQLNVKHLVELEHLPLTAEVEPSSDIIATLQHGEELTVTESRSFEGRLRLKVRGVEGKSARHPGVEGWTDWVVNDEGTELEQKLRHRPFPLRESFQATLHERWSEEQPFETPNDVESFLARAWTANFTAYDLNEMMVEQAQTMIKLQGVLAEHGKAIERIEKMLEPQVSHAESDVTTAYM